MTDACYKLLYSPRRTKKRIKLKEQQIEEIQQTILPSGISYDKDKIQTSPEDPMLKYIEKKESLEIELQNLKAQYDAELQRLCDEINSLEDPNEMEVLMSRFINGISCDRQATYLNYERTTIFKWQRRGIYHIEEHLQKERINKSQQSNVVHSKM